MVEQPAVGTRGYDYEDKMKSREDLLKKIASIGNKIRFIEKSSKAHFGKSTSLPQVQKIINKELRANNLLLTTEVVQQNRLLIKVFDLDNGWHEEFNYVLAMNTDPTKDATQAWGAMCTYGRRYALTMLFNLITPDENDPDAVYDTDEDEDWFYTVAIPRLVKEKPENVGITTRNWVNGKIDRKIIEEVMQWD